MRTMAGMRAAVEALVFGGKRPGQHAGWPAEPALAAFLVGAATIMAEVALTRVFAFTQGYHFAFLAVSLALMGNAAGGAALAARSPRRLVRGLPARPLFWCLLTGVCLPLALIASGSLPVDTYALSWSWRQLSLLFLYLACLALPFVVAGVAAALCFERAGAAVGSVYAANLSGSALGAALAALLLPWLGAARGVAAAGALALLAGLWLRRGLARWLWPLLALGALVLPWEGLLTAQMSPHKPLWQALHARGAASLASFWSRSGRVDVVEGPNLRMAGGIALDCPYAVPAQRQLFLDGDSPSPISQAQSAEEVEFTRCLPAWAGLELRQAQRTLVLEPAGDVPVWLALSATSGEVQVVEPNPGLLRGLLDPEWGSAALRQPRVVVRVASPRALLRREKSLDLVYFPLRGSYRPVGWGAASLVEDYGVSVQAFADALSALAPGGLLVAESWLQLPPSEPLRLWLTLIAALRERGVTQPGRHLLAARSMQTVLVAASPSGWSGTELERVRTSAADLGLDLVWLPGLQPEEANVINVLPEDNYYATFRRALETDTSWLRGYPFQVAPATDTRPFPHDYFRWSQVGQVLRQVGRTSQPFAGLGFLVLPLMLLILSPLLVALLVPSLLQARSAPKPLAVLGFLALGLGYIALELPLIQQAMLLFREVSLAMALVLSAMLLGSGVASALTARLPGLTWVRLPLACAVLALLATGPLVARLLTAPGWLQALSVAAYAALAGFGLGGAFPTLMKLGTSESGQRAWALAVNGAASVAGSVLATGVAVLWGFRAAFGLAVAAYALVAILSLSARRLAART